MAILCVPFFAAAQPANYYNNALGLNGQPLRSALHNIIKAHNSLGYSALWSSFLTTDATANGKVWDIYSDKPGGTPAYQYTFVTDQCGNYNAEGDCFNREHTFPQSYFNNNEPMLSDLFQVYPTDGWVNNKRSNYAYGEVNNATYTSSNGSKLGNNSFAGAPSGQAFEPIDSFKGDLARTYFYMATRYYNEDNGWSNWEMANGAELKPWVVTMLLQWHHDDPVSAKEINRNNAVYNLQQNRNPFIDQPLFADCIWGTGNCLPLATSEVLFDKQIQLYPNPATDKVFINLQELNPEEVLAVDLINLQGQVVTKITPTYPSTSIAVHSLAKGIYVVRIYTSKSKLYEKLIVE